MLSKVISSKESINIQSVFKRFTICLKINIKQIVLI